MNANITGCKKQDLINCRQTQEEIMCGHAVMPCAPTDNESNGRRLIFTRSITGRFHQDASLDRATYLKKVQNRRAAYIANLDEWNRLRGLGKASSLSSDLLIDVLISDVDHSIGDEKPPQTTGTAAVVSQSVNRGISARSPCPTISLPKRPSTTAAVVARSPMRLGATSPVMKENRQAANDRAIQVYNDSVYRRPRPPRRPGSRSPRRPDSASPRRTGSTSPRRGSRRVRWTEGRLLCGERRRATAPESRRGRGPWSSNHNGARIQTLSAVPRPGEMDAEDGGGDGPDWQQVPFRPLGRDVGPGGAGYSRPVSAFAGHRDEEEAFQHEKCPSCVSEMGREHRKEGLDTRAIPDPVVVQDTQTEEQTRRPSTGTCRLREAAETPAMQRARLLELQRLAKEKKELEAQLVEVKLLMRVATGGKVCWKAATRDLPVNGPIVCRPVRRRRRKRRPSTAPSMERQRESVTTTEDPAKLEPADPNRKAKLAVPSERADKMVGMTPSKKNHLEREKRIPVRGARETRPRQSDDGGVRGETGRMRQPGVTFGACRVEVRPATVGGTESTFRESVIKHASSQLQRPKSASPKPNSVSRQPMTRALAGAVTPEAGGAGMKVMGAKRNDTRRVDGVLTRPLSARCSDRNGQSLGDSDGRSKLGWGGRKRGRRERDSDKQALTVSSSRRQKFVANVSSKQVAASEPQRVLDRTTPKRQGAVMATTPSAEDVTDGYEDDFDTISLHASRVYESDFEPLDKEQTILQPESGNNQDTIKKNHPRPVRKDSEQQRAEMIGGGAGEEGGGGDCGDSLGRNRERGHRTATDSVLRRDEHWSDGRDNASVSGGSGDALSWGQWSQQDGYISANEEWNSVRKGSLRRRRKSRTDAVGNHHKRVGPELSSSYDELDTGDATETGLSLGVARKDGNYHLGRDANANEERVVAAPVSEGGSSLYDMLLSSHVSSSDESWSLKSSLHEQNETMDGNSRHKFSVSRTKMGVGLGDTIVDDKAPTAMALSSDGSSMYESLSSLSSTARASDEVEPVDEFSSSHPPRLSDFKDAGTVAAIIPPSSRGVRRVPGSLTSGMEEPDEALVPDTRRFTADRSGYYTVGDEDGDRGEDNRRVIDDDPFNESFPHDKAHRVLVREGSSYERVSGTLKVVAGAVSGDQDSHSFRQGEHVEGNIENTGSFDEWSPGGHPQQGSLDEDSLDDHAFGGQYATTGRQDVGVSGDGDYTVDDELENKLSFDELSLDGATPENSTGQESGEDLASGERFLVERDSTRNQLIDRPGEHGHKGPFDGYSLDDRRHRGANNEGSLDRQFLSKEQPPEATVSSDQKTNDLGDNDGTIIEDELENKRLLGELRLDQEELGPEWPDEGSRGKRLLEKGFTDQHRLVAEATVGDQNADRAGRRSRPSEGFLEKRESFDELPPDGNLHGDFVGEGARADSSLDALPLVDQGAASDQSGGPVGGRRTGHDDGMEKNEPLDESSLDEFEPQRDGLDHGQPSNKTQSVHNQRRVQTTQHQDRKYLDDHDSFGRNFLGIGSNDDTKEYSGHNSRQPTLEDGSLDEYLYDDNSFEEPSFGSFSSRSLDGGDVVTLDDNDLSADGNSLFDEQSLGGNSIYDHEFFEEQ